LRGYDRRNVGELDRRLVAVDYAMCHSRPGFAVSQRIALMGMRILASGGPHWFDPERGAVM
jgi:hypothetical protein